MHLSTALVAGSWARLPAEPPAPPILVALADADARIRVAAGLVAAGCRVIVARSAGQAAAHLASVDAVVTDARVAGALPRAPLRATPIVLLAGEDELLPDAPARLGAAAIFRAPYDVDDIVAIVVHSARWTAP